MQLAIYNIIITFNKWVTPNKVYAQTPDLSPDLLDRMVGVADGAGYDVSTGPDDTFFAETLGTIVQVALSLLGVLFISLMIYAGYNWMIARGDEQKVTEAKNTIKNSVIGLILVVSAYAIWGIVRQLF